MPSARLLILRYWGVVMLVGLALSHPTIIKATTYQSCVEGSPCVVGEYVYADDATPIATASCRLTSYNPGGSFFLNAVSLPGTADGWYAFGFMPTATYSAGTYPSQLCCTTHENNICIDKSFTITMASATPTPGLTQSDVSSAVWNATMSGYTNSGSFGQQVGQLQNNTITPGDIWSYSGRTLSNFGTLVTDIWGSANRSLTSVTNIVSGLWNAQTTDYDDPGSFGDKVNTTTNLTPQQVWEYNNRSLTGVSNIATSVWDNSSRSLTSFGSLVSDIWTRPNRTLDPAAATPLDLTIITREINTSRDLIEKLIAMPGTTMLPSEDSIDYAALLEAKITKTKEYTSQISANLDSVSTKIGILALNWDTLSETDRIQELQEVITLLGTDEGDNPTTIVGQLKWLSNVWDKPVTNELYADMVEYRDDLTNFLTTFQVASDTNSQTDEIGALFTRITALRNDVGDISQSSAVPSLYGMLRSIKDLAASFSRSQQAVEAATTNWASLSPADQLSTVQNIANDLIKINQLPALRDLLYPVEATPAYLENLSAVINLNRAVLASDNQKPVIVNWIDQNATRYRTFVYNPLRSSATATVNYAMPVEITLEDVTQTPKEFILNYDPQTKALTVNASVALNPSQSQVFDITTTDLWKIRPEDIEALRNQAAELMKPLENTPRYTEAATIKSSIDVALDTITALRSSATTPSTRIQTFRQAQTLLTEVNHLMERLKQLVTDHQSGKSLMGFIGGAQAIAVWGIIVIFIAGFIFLTMYMRTLYTSTINQPATVSADNLPLVGPAVAPEIAPPPLNFSLPFSIPNMTILTDKRFFLSLILLSSLLLTIMVSRQVNPPKQFSLHPSNPNTAVPAVSLLEPSPAPSITPTPLPTPEPTPVATTSSLILIAPPDVDMKVAVRSTPNSLAKTITQIISEEPAQQLETNGKWLKVELSSREPIISGWIHEDLAIILPQ